MHISCDKKLLMDNINIVIKCVSSRTTSPILECILLKADRKGFRLIANDLEQSIETANIEGADVYTLGEVALDAKMFFDFVRSMPEGKIDIECDDKFITTIKNGRTIKISGLDGSEFPLPKEIESGECFKINGGILKNMVKKTIFSIAVMDYRPTLTGELFEFKGHRLNIVAVDGHRIAFRTQLLDDSRDKKIIVPGKALNEFTRLVEDDKETELYFNEKFIQFKFEKCTLTSRLLEGDYLEYGNMFTNDFKTSVQINREALLNSLECCMLLIAREIKKVEVVLEISDGVMKVNAENSIGNINDEIPVNFDGEDLRIGFSPKYLIDVCRAIDEENINMYFLGNLSPCIIKSSVGSEDFKYLVLPVKI